MTSGIRRRRGTLSDAADAREDGEMYSETPLPDGAALWRSLGSDGAVIPADGCVDLILRDDRVFVAGPSTRWIATESDGETGSVGLRFAPGRAGRMLRTELSDLADQLLPLDAIVHGEPWRHLHQAMMRYREGATGIGQISSIVEPASASSDWAPAVHSQAIAAVPATQVASELGDSERTFRRRMLTTFGYGYATLVRIERAHRAQKLLRRGVPLSAAAAEAGFADQPHLSREFRRLVGASPGQFASSSA
ncbi:helix-turn-helix domain-containing protein [Microbacterium sp. SSW1-49]|uniref:Helix-turn-helix domain-containing protein n=1 Tax=Microbacterium croceum TaxID=2851645 RepID=A0ABT0FAS6_9MICO|nr:helix-turn-helix domain-containing protein [Microbacterium croceum]MCK2035166.1 helix-turn-helix domain-containing protein [Microbacterium croceum]